MSDHTDIQRNSELVALDEQTASAGCRLFFGGSFDPPHVGHIRLSIAFARAMGGAHVVFVPACRSPFKDSMPTADHHRVAMLRLALEDCTGCEIWEQELHDGNLNGDQPSYWADTWAIVQRLNLPGSNRFLIGGDQALSMHRWHRYREFWRYAVVMIRNDEKNMDDLRPLIDQLETGGHWTDEEIEHWRSQIIALPTLDVSSSALREALRDPYTREQPIDGLEPRVQGYILKHRLYL